MASDINAITDSLYNHVDIQPLEDQRRELLAQMRALDGEINDHLQNIDVYQSLVSDLTQTLDAKAAGYHDAIARKPSKPFFLVNILTFGAATTPNGMPCAIRSCGSMRTTRWTSSWIKTSWLRTRAT